MTLIHYRKVTYIVSGILVLGSVILFFTWGLKPGIDFTGGSLLEAEFHGPRPDTSELVWRAESAGISHVSIQPTGERGILLRSEHLSEEIHQHLLVSLQNGNADSLAEKRFDDIGPTIGAELRRNSFYAIGLVILLIVLYIALTFRKVSEPVASWKYGVATVVALVHDVLIPVGAFVILGHFFGVEVDTLFVTALLTILGFSVHDTIVAFDRIRENLKNQHGKAQFETVVGESISQTITRSINTSFTVLLVLIVIYFFGGESTKLFSLALIVGIFFGTYSSIFLASPLLVTWQKFGARK